MSRIDIRCNKRDDFLFAVPVDSGAALMHLLSENFIATDYRTGPKRHYTRRFVYLGDPLAVITSRFFVEYGCQLCRNLCHHLPNEFAFEVDGVEQQLSLSEALCYWRDAPPNRTGRRVFYNACGGDGGRELVAAIAEWHAKYGSPPRKE